MSNSIKNVAIIGGKRKGLNQPADLIKVKGFPQLGEVGV